MTLSLSQSQTITLFNIIKGKISIIQDYPEIKDHINLETYCNFISLATNNTNNYTPSVVINSDFIDNFTTDEFNVILAEIEEKIKETIDDSYLLYIQAIRNYWLSMFTYM